MVYSIFSSDNRIVGRSALQQSNDVLVELSPSDDETCMFCDTKDINEKLYGSLYGLNEVILHSFCNVSKTKILYCYQLSFILFIYFFYVFSYFLL